MHEYARICAGMREYALSGWDSQWLGRNVRTGLGPKGRTWLGRKGSTTKTPAAIPGGRVNTPSPNIYIYIYM